MLTDSDLSEERQQRIENFTAFVIIMTTDGQRNLGWRMDGGQWMMDNEEWRIDNWELTIDY